MPERRNPCMPCFIQCMGLFSWPQYSRNGSGDGGGGVCGDDDDDDDTIL